MLKETSWKVIKTLLSSTDPITEQEDGCSLDEENERLSRNLLYKTCSKPKRKKIMQIGHAKSKKSITQKIMLYVTLLSQKKENHAKSCKMVFQNHAGWSCKIMQFMDKSIIIVTSSQNHEK